MDKLHVKSRIPDGLPLFIDTSELEFCNVVSMCIKDINQSSYSIPDQFTGIMDELLFKMIGCGMLDGDWDYDQYCYITIKKMFINPNTCGNRSGWHIDGFLSDQRNFIWSDCEATPTEVSVGDFYLSKHHDYSIDEMYEQGFYNFNAQLSVNTLYEMDQNIVHRPTENYTGKPVLRTFIKLTYSKELFNGFGNAWNYKLPNIKPTSNRAVTRNHGVINDMDHGVL